jgi:Tol biopolymer transport system component/uncharacterized protein YjdB
MTRTPRPRSFTALAAAALLAAACSDRAPAPGPVPVAAVQLSRTQHGLVPGETVQLSATPRAADGAALADRPVQWRSTRDAVATVSAQGLVTARGAGTATIVASSGGREAHAAVTVTAPAPGAVASLTMVPADVAVPVGQPRRVEVLARDAHGTPLYDRAVVWASADESVATVSAAGVVTGVRVGTTRITAASEGKTAEAQVTVGGAPAGSVAGVTLNVAAVALEEGASRQLEATPRDEAGQPIEGLGMVWTTSDQGVAQVGALGRVVAVRSGTATITVRVHGRTAQAEVTVSSSAPYDLVYAAAGAGSALYRLDFRQPGAAPTPFAAAAPAGISPAVSPDGSKLAFAATVDGQPGIYVANRDGSNRRRVVGWTNGTPSEPTWSPDGGKLAYTATRGTGESDVWVVNADGSSPANVTADVEGANQAMPAWSPRLADGTSRIAFVQPISGAWRIWTMRPDGSGKRQVTAGVGDVQPAWSPDGQTIAFQRTGSAVFGDIWLADAAGGNERALMPAYALPGPQWSPAWSPDGRMIAFTSAHETYGTGAPVQQVYTVWADGSKLARRTGPDAAEKAAPVWLPR